MQRTRPVAKLLESSNRGVGARRKKQTRDLLTFLSYSLQQLELRLLSVCYLCYNGFLTCFLTYPQAPLCDQLQIAMSSKLLPTRPLLRAQLTTRPSNGHGAFIPQIRKIVFEYCDQWPSSANTRTFLRNHLTEVARANPHVEFVVKQRTYRQPIARGFYRECHHSLYTRLLTSCARSQ